jgi:hypothetical protein
MKRARILAALVGALGLAVAWSASAFACGSGKILFEDKFANLDPSWGITLGDGWSVGQGLKMTMKPGDYNTYLNQTSLYDNYEVCLTVSAQLTGDDSVDPYVIFWGTDSDNFYEAGVSPHYGKYSVWRKQHDKWLSPVNWTVTPAVKKNAGDANEISVTVNGNHAVININGQKVIEFNGQAPDGGSQIGIDANYDKGNKNPCVLTVTDFQVRAVQ